MLREKIIKSDESGALPPRPVGRTYAIRVLRGAEGMVPMSAVDTKEVRGQCKIALLQTMIRDVLAVAAVIASALLEPLGTVIVFRARRGGYHSGGTSPLVLAVDGGGCHSRRICTFHGHRPPASLIRRPLDLP